MRLFSCIIVVVFISGVSTAAIATTNVSLQEGKDHAAANSAALQAVIDHAASGDTVELPKGTFALSDSISLKIGISIAGTGIKTTTLTAAFAHPQPMVVGSGLTKVEIQGFSLDGAGDGNVTQGIQLEKSSGLDLHDLAIENLPGSNQPDAPLGPHAIDCTTAVSNSVFNSITATSIGVGRTWGGGIRLSWKSIGNRITNCTISKTGRGGIFCNDGSTDNIIADNTVSSSGGVGLGIEVQNCDRSLIERNKIDHWLSVDNSSMSGIRGNTINAADNTYKLCGIEVVDSHDVIIADNAVTGGAKVGLSISGPHAKERMLLVNNLFARATTWGAQIQGDAGGADELYFEHNGFNGTQTGPDPLYPNQGHGLRINGNAHALTFERNEMTHNAGFGLQITGDQVDDLCFYKNLLAENRGGVTDSDPIKHLIWAGNQTPPTTTRWMQFAKANGPPKIALNLTGAKLELAGSNHWLATSGSSVHFAIDSKDGFTPHDDLWDFDFGLPHSGLTADQVFDKPGSYPIEIVVWDASGRAAHLTATIDVKKPPTTGR
jgi:parallel beta-helix repeat protein